MATLDSIDRRLLAELQAEGRVTNVDLARRVGLTAPPCLRRVRALEEAGVIRGYHAELDASKLGFAITVFAMVSLKSQAEEDLRGVREAHQGAARSARVPHAQRRDRLHPQDRQQGPAELPGIPHQQAHPAPNVASVKTSLTIRTAKNEPGVPLE